MNVCTVILGAGKGSRMKSITPKPFHKVANLKLIDWVLNTHNSIKIDKKIIVTSKNIEPYAISFEISFVVSIVPLESISSVTVESIVELTAVIPTDLVNSALAGIIKINNDAKLNNIFFIAIFLYSYNLNYVDS